MKAPDPRPILRRGGAAKALGAICLIAVVVIGGTILWRVTQPGTAATQPQELVTAPGTAPGIPPGTGLVATLPYSRNGGFSWAPDGAHLLVFPGDQYATRVYDRSGKLVSQFVSLEGWLDAAHLIDGSGYVADVGTSHSGGPTENSWVVASGHGAAAIIVGVPGCTGDPIIDWYRDGKYVKTGQKVSPFGWSPDGKLVLLGHMSCSSQDAEMNGWKGPVDVVDFHSGRIVATAPDVRGEMAFNPSATRLAAQSDGDVEVVGVSDSQVRRIPNARFLGWLDDDSFYCVDRQTVKLVDVASGATGTVVETGEWQLPSGAGPRLVADASGAVRRIVGSDGATLLDLSSAGLSVFANPTYDHMSSEVQQPVWSPDGRMLALESKDGTALDIFSVDPAKTGAVGSALPTPIGAPLTLVEADRAALPGPVAQLVSDTKRNAFWFLGGDAAGPVALYRYDVATATLSRRPLTGTTYDAVRDRVAIAPDGRIWIGAGSQLIVYDPGTDRQTSANLSTSGADVQTDPQLGRPDPWIAGIAFDATGNALVARNWVRSLLRVDASLAVLPGAIDVSDGFPMTGGMVVAGGRVFVLADPKSGLGFSVDATGTGKLFNTKFQAPALAAVGDHVITAGTPPGLIGPDGGGAAMIEPVMASADLVAAGPGGVAALYDNPSGELQLRGNDGHVTAQGVFASGKAPRIATIAFDGGGRLWAVETTGGASSLVRLDMGAAP